MTEAQEIGLYQLLRVPGLTSAALRRLLEFCRGEPEGLEAAWGRPLAEYRSRWGLSERAARFLHRAESLSHEQCMAEQAAEAARRADIELLSVLEEPYASLAAVRELPPVLFTRGNQDLLESPLVAVIHSRDAAEEALTWGTTLASEVAGQGIGLVTSQSRETYQRVATAAKRAGAPLLIVLDRSLHQVRSTGSGLEPVPAARLWDERFHSELELVVSGIMPGQAWQASHLRARDQLVIGLADIVVAGAVRPEGNMAALCARAARVGRPVFLSLFCRASINGAALPETAAEASGIVVEAARGLKPGWEESPARRERPGWLKRRREEEVGRFLAALTSSLGATGWIERRPIAPAHGSGGAQMVSPDGAIAAVVCLPAWNDHGEEEVIVVHRRDAGVSAQEPPALLLSPGEPICDLEGFRSYLARSLHRLRDAVKTPRT